MKRRGFTLVELLAVIGILVALATMTAISVARIGKDTRITKAANDLLNVLETARGLAIRTHQPTMVAFRARTERFDQSANDPMKYPNPARIKRRWTEAVVGRLIEPLQFSKPEAILLSSWVVLLSHVYPRDFGSSRRA